MCAHLLKLRCMYCIINDQTNERTARLSNCFQLEVKYLRKYKYVSQCSLACYSPSPVEFKIINLELRVIFHPKKYCNQILRSRWQGFILRNYLQ